ncbi:MAG: hypothetical protein RQ866_01265 [Bacteroidales bacterium]|nr:hypothetical protein [Bacteroidales bacterium]
MKKQFLILLFFAALAIQLQSQTAIVIQNGSKTYMSNRMDNIKVNIDHGDTIYLPGGIINLYGNWIIDKEVHIFGVGFFPDSSLATGITNIPNYHIYFVKGSSNSSIEGIYTANTINIGYNSSTMADSVDNITIKRCRINQITLGYSTYSQAANINILHSIINTIDFRNAIFVNIEKNIINGRITNINGNVLLKNNIFFWNDDVGYSQPPLTSNVQNVLFKNNIFLDNESPGTNYCTFSNNIFAHSTPSAGTNLFDATNIFVNNVDSIKFVSYDNITLKDYTFMDDIHLQPTSPAKNIGDDGTDAGIYGTAIPVKEGWVPITPHVQLFNIAPNSINGKLPVEVKVKAQSSY